MEQSRFQAFLAGLSRNKFKVFISFVALLIWYEVGGEQRLQAGLNGAVSFVHSFGPQEEPAPGQAPAAFGWDNSEAIHDRARREQQERQPPNKH